MNVCLIVLTSVVIPFLDGTRSVDWSKCAASPLMDTRVGADWDVVGRVAAERGIPVIGNGDILTHYEARERMARFLKNHARDKHGAHRYTLEDFGIDAERDAQDFEEYYRRYGVERLLPGGDET